MEESIKVEDPKFEWGKKRGIGGKKKDVQFYESFTYDGEEYRLYDCVLVCKDGEPEPFIGKIIKIWETLRIKNQRKIKLLWFFKPSEISFYLEGVSDILANELFLASGEGVGLANINPLEAIAGKCSVLCISKDKRNPQPSDEEIKNTHFVFRRTFDVGRLKIVDQIDDQIAGIDVKFIFNRTSENKASTSEKVEADIGASLDSMKRDGPSTSGLAKQNEVVSSEALNHRENGIGGKEGKESEDHKQQPKQNSALAAEEEATHDSGRHDIKGHTERDSYGVSGATKRSYMVEEKESANESGGRDEGARDERAYEASGSPRIHGCVRKVEESKVITQLSKQKSIVDEGTKRKDSDGLDEKLHKRRKLDGSLTKSSGTNTKMPQKVSSHGGKDIKPAQISRDKITKRGFLSPKSDFVNEKQELQVLTSSEQKDTKTAAPVANLIDKSSTAKSLSKKPSFDSKVSRHSEGPMLTDDDYKRNYKVIEVTRRPDHEKRKWFRDVAWEERMRNADEQGTLVLLQNLDPAYTSDEVEDIVYSSLNEQCTARMIERTSITIPHIGEAFLIFKRKEVACRVVKRLSEGCLLLSNGRPLLATFAKLTPPGKSPPLLGHIKLKTPMQRDMRDAVATSHCSQPNTIEYDMAMEWCLHQSRWDNISGKLFKQQSEEIKKSRVNFKPETSLAAQHSGPPISNIKAMD